MILLFWLLACGAVTPAPPRTQGVEAPAPLTTAKGLYHLSWKADPSPIAMGSLFSVETTLTDANGQPVEDATVQVDARMPQHGHGMTTRPVADPGVCGGAACLHPQGLYRMDGMKFHMAGEWTILFTVNGPAGPDTAEARYTL